MGYLFAPLAFVIGIPWGEAVQAGGLLGIKLVLNEFVAFAQFGPSIAQYSDKTVAVMTFALAGFANFGTIGILLGGIGGMAPTGGATSPASGCGPFSPPAWPTCSTARSPACSSTDRAGRRVQGP